MSKRRKKLQRSFVVETLETRRLMTGPHTIALDQILPALPPSQIGPHSRGYGFHIDGINDPSRGVNNRTGYSVSGAGDLNDDGFDEVVVGTPGGNGRDQQCRNSRIDSKDGYTQVIYGPSGATNRNVKHINTSHLNRSDGLTIHGVDAYDQSGSAVTNVQDADGDGRPEIAIGAFRANSYRGESYLVSSFPQGGSPNSPVHVDLCDNNERVRMNVSAAPAQQSSRSLSSAGDINANGYGELLVGAPFGGVSRRGLVYVVSGSSSITHGYNNDNEIKLTSDPNVTKLRGPKLNNAMFGYSVSHAGDVNGDGYADVVVGAPFTYATRRAGRSYISFGGPAGPSAMGLNVEIIGASGTDLLGFSVSGGGDIDGDGYDDVIIGAKGASPNGVRSAGQTYVVFGGPSLPSRISVNSPSVLKINGANRWDQSGFSVSHAGDWNADGFDDILIGAPLSGAYNAGASYVVFGHPNLRNTQAISLGKLNGTNGFKLLGIDRYDYSGFSVKYAKDTNGDGFADIIIGAPFADQANNNRNSGEAYVVFGANFGNVDIPNGIPISNIGNVADNRIVGTKSRDIIIGHQGNDTLFGFGGADTLRGGQGEDLFVVPDADFAPDSNGIRRRIHGGTGTSDRIKFDGTQGTTVNLTHIADNRITDVEELDFRNGKGDSLTLNYREVVNLSTHSNSVTVWRDAVDTVFDSISRSNVFSSTEWLADGTELVRDRVDGKLHTFSVFKHKSTAGMLRIQQPTPSRTTVVPQPIPYFQTFDSGKPDAAQGWEYYSSDSEGRIRVQNGELSLDRSRSGGFTLNEAILHLNLVGQSNVKLQFDHDSLSDNLHTMRQAFTGRHNSDGVAFSADGITWYRLLSLTSDFRGRQFDLDAAVASAGISYTSDFRIKFQQYDNFPNPSDGRKFDNIRVDSVTASVPEIMVQGNNVNIVDGAAVPNAANGTDFGSAYVGQSPPLKTYVIRNTGTGILSVGVPQVPAGFTLVKAPASTIAGGSRDTFIVRMNTATAGTKQGEVRLATNDLDENPFNFRIRGVVGAIVPTVPPQSIPYSQTFSSGKPTAAQGWEYYSSDIRGQIRIHNGKLRMTRASAGVYTLNEAILHLNLAGKSNVKLRFDHDSLDDNFHGMKATFTGHDNADGVAFSADGITWFRLLSLSSDFRNREFDLDAAVAAAGISYTSDFRIKFQQYDNYPDRFDGRDFDNIVVTAR